jgi:GNAT superfamily N-acetyltransferase
MSDPGSLRPPYLVEPLKKDHQLDAFDCGRVSLNDWLRKYALANQQADSARTYVLTLLGNVAGYYSLTAGSVAKEEAPARIAKGLAKHPIGVVLLARLAVDRSFHRMGFGKILLGHALRRALVAAEAVGVRAILVHALDQEAAAFYEKFLFERSPLNPMQLMLLLKDLRATFDSVA